MPFDKIRYLEVKHKILDNIESGRKNYYCYIKEYELAILREDYEAAKAITEILQPLGYVLVPKK